MDAEIVAALWFECKDLSDIERTLLQALAYHCHNTSTCWPSIPRLARMIRRTERQTRTILRNLERMEYISTQVQRGRRHSNIYSLNRKHILPVSEKIGSPDFRSKPEAKTSAELLLEEERKEEQNPEALLLKLGLTRGSVVWIAAMNGHQKYS
jgi:Helix-turn-helix domain